MQPLGTFSLHVFNQGRAPAREVCVGHIWLPAHNVFPDIPREVEQTPGGSTIIRFPVVPPGTLISISYLIPGAFTVVTIISYLGYEDGIARPDPSDASKNLAELV